VSEFDDQVYVFDWATLMAPTYPELEFLFATLNGVRLSRGLIYKMVRCGCLVKGVPDIWFPVRRGPCPGLVMELKAARIPGKKANYPEPEQRRFLAHLVADGWMALPVWGGEAAVGVLQSYLERPLT
jgi:hypothetical protein